jgi:hypothetical protein
MAKYVHRPLAPLNPGNKVKWRDPDGDHLKRGGIYTVTAVDGHWFTLEHIRVNWGWDISQFERVE